MELKQKNSDKPRNLPIDPELSLKLFGRGKDNQVYEVKGPDETSKGMVVKLNHKTSPTEAARLAETGADREQAWKGIQYKQHKYAVLKHFMGDYIPDSMFVLTQEGLPDKRRYVEMTVQKQVPQVGLADLSPEQRADPALAENVKGLLGRLQYMYRVLGETNARVGQEAQLDGKLDLGGISSAVRDQQLDHAFSPEEVEALIASNQSPNLLVDPESMQLYCVDFYQGQWNDGMANSTEIAFEIDRRNRVESVAGQLGSAALAPVFPPVMTEQRHASQQPPT